MRRPRPSGYGDQLMNMDAALLGIALVIAVLIAAATTVISVAVKAVKDPMEGA
jgi:hypothetical protein